MLLQSYRTLDLQMQGHTYLAPVLKSTSLHRFILLIHFIELEERVTKTEVDNVFYIVQVYSRSF